MLNFLNGEKSERIKGAGCFHFDGNNKTWREPKKLKHMPNEKFVKFQYAKDFINSMDIPEPGESIYAIVSGSFIFGDILGPIAKKIGGNVTLDICTLSIGQENIDMIDQMFEENLISSVRIIFSDYFYSHENKPGGLWRYLMDILEKWPDRYTVSVASVHTKIIMMRSESHNLILSGSANLRSSANVEQFDIQNNQGLYNFNLDWMNEIHSQFAVNRKPLRSRKNLAGIFE